MGGDRPPRRPPDRASRLRRPPGGGGHPAGHRAGDGPVDGLEKALAGLGLLDDALALDMRKPQDYFHRVWSTAFRASDLASADSDDGAEDDGQHDTGEDEHREDAKVHP